MGVGLPPCSERCPGCAPEGALDCALFQKEHCGGQKIPKVMRGSVYRKATEWFERRVEGKTGGPLWEGLQEVKEQTGTGVLAVNEEYTYMCTYTYLLKRHLSLQEFKRKSQSQ